MCIFNSIFNCVLLIQTEKVNNGKHCQRKENGKMRAGVGGIGGIFGWVYGLDWGVGAAKGAGRGAGRCGGGRVGRRKGAPFAAPGLRGKLRRIAHPTPARAEPHPPEPPCGAERGWVRLGL